MVGKLPIRLTQRPTLEDPLRSASLSEYLSETGHSDLTLKIDNMATISMVSAPEVDQHLSRFQKKPFGAAINMV